MKAPEFGLDRHKILHGEEALKISTPIPAEGELIGRTRVAADPILDALPTSCGLAVSSLASGVVVP
jgi:hypothetical protein